MSATREQLKQALRDPATICKQLGLDHKSKPQAGGVLIQCPVHDDNTPSCSVTAGLDGTIRVNCFGCDFAGDVFHLIAAAEDIDVRRDFARVLDLAEELMTGSASSSPPVASPRTAAEPKYLSINVLALTMLAECRLEDDAGVWEYLKRRGIARDAVHDGWGALPRDAKELAKLLLMLQRRFGRDLVIGAGLVREDGSSVHPQHRLIIPWRDEAGKIVTLQRRCLNSEEPRYVFPKGRGPTAPFGVERVAAAGPRADVIFVEGAVDALAMRALCRDHDVDAIILGLPGVSGLTDSCGSFSRGRVVRLAFDADVAGEKAASKIAPLCWAAGATEVVRSRPLSGTDWAEHVAARGVR